MHKNGANHDEVINQYGRDTSKLENTFWNRLEIPSSPVFHWNRSKSSWLVLDYDKTLHLILPCIFKRSFFKFVVKFSCENLVKHVTSSAWSKKWIMNSRIRFLAWEPPCLPDIDWSDGFRSLGSFKSFGLFYASK